MESTTVRRVYRFRLEPNPMQEEGFRRYAGARRFVWNWALQQKREHDAATRKGLSEKELSARLTALKSEPATAWLREMDSQLLQQVLTVLDASMGTIRRQLAYKGQWRRVHVVAVGRFYPSSKLCHECGHKHDGLTLADRAWVCPSCGAVLDRDLNAARNIKDEGLRIRAAAVGHTEALNARGECVGRPMGAALATPA